MYNCLWWWVTFFSGHKSKDFSKSISPHHTVSVSLRRCDDIWPHYSGVYLVKQILLTASSHLLSKQTSTRLWPIICDYLSFVQAFSVFGSLLWKRCRSSTRFEAPSCPQVGYDSYSFALSRRQWTPHRFCAIPDLQMMGGVRRHVACCIFLVANSFTDISRRLVKSSGNDRFSKSYTQLPTRANWSRAFAWRLLWSACQRL